MMTTKTTNFISFVTCETILSKYLWVKWWFEGKRRTGKFRTTADCRIKLSRESADRPIGTTVL